MHPVLTRLDRLADRLAADSDVIAVLGLGSAGVETDRFDDHSDIDFFIVVTDDDARRRYLETTDWLDGFGARLAFSFVNDPNGRKALLEDGLFLEYAIFTGAGLAEVPFCGARIVWSRPGFTVTERVPQPPTSIDTVDFHLNEALTNLFVGLHRELRGERLTATRLIQVHAIDRLLALQRLDPASRRTQPDPFEATRRAERTTGRPLPLAAMCAGYERNAEAAATALEWICRWYEPNPALVAALEDLIERVLKARHDPTGAARQREECRSGAVP